MLVSLLFFVVWLLNFICLSMLHLIYVAGCLFAVSASVPEQEFGLEAHQRPISVLPTPPLSLRDSSQISS